MNTKLFVGGLPYETTQSELLKMFSSAGAVFGVKLIMDKETGRSKGYAFVEMSTEADAKAAMEKLNGAAVGARKMFISEARPQEKKDGPGGRPAFAAKPAFAPAPGFVERRSGKDRRQRPGFGAPSGVPASAGFAAPSDRRAPPVAEKKWSSKFGFGEKKPWADKKKPGFAEKKPWADKKPWSARKAWADKPSTGDKPGGYAGKKKPWSDLPTAGKSGGKKPWERKPEGKPGGFTRKVRRGSN